jgi:hypothetical protein
VPDWPDIGIEAKGALVRYAREGGSLLMAGAENGLLFAPELAVRPLGAPSDLDAFIPAGELFASLRGRWQEVQPERAAQLIERRYPIYDSSRDAACAATITELGKGKAVAFYGPLGNTFAAAHSPAVRRLVRGLVERVFTPYVALEAPPVVEVTLRRGNGRLLVNLANCAGMQVGPEYVAVDWIPPVTSIGINLKLPRRPKRVTVEPEGRSLPGDWKDGAWTGLLPRLDIHSILAFEVY